ncbi:MAG: DUF1501 domain-containing protein [Pirellulales bacterium]
MTQSKFARRDFLTSASAVGCGLAIGTGMPGPWMQALANSAPSGDRVLVVIQLSGGNDGLNTVVPYRDEAYRKARPKLGVPATDVLKINSEIGFHPALEGVSRLMEGGRFSIVQGVGYPKPNRSHFESMDIWHTCQTKKDRAPEGWLGRWIANAQREAKQDSLGLHLGSEQQPLALVGRGVQVPSVASINQFRWNVQPADLTEIQTPEQLGSLRDAKSSKELEMEKQTKEGIQSNDLLGFVQSSTASALEASQRLDAALKNPDGGKDFPSSPLGEKLKIISRLISAGLSTRVYYVTLDGFDTHSQQSLAHAGLLRQWSEALTAFVKRLETTGHADRVAVMTFSEFGRRVAENASEGTDHGAAAPIFFAGPRMPSQIIGEVPNLVDLNDGDIKFKIDFRQVYSSIIEQWFEGNSSLIFGTSYPGLKLFS